MIVTLAQSKGGTGKSMLTLNLAATAAKRGGNVLILDTDPQKTLTEILALRAEVAESMKNLSTFQASYTVTKDLPTLLPQLEKRYDAIFIDTAGFDNGLMWNTVAASDVVLIPVAHGAADLLTATKMVQKIGQIIASTSLQARFVLNRFQPHLRYTTTYLRDLKTLTDAVPKTKTDIHLRAAYVDCFSYGAGVTEIAAHTQAATDMYALYDEIMGLNPNFLADF